VYQVPTTTRENVDVPLSRTQKTRFCPGILGGNEWNGASFDPQRNALYVGAVDWCASVQLLPEAVAPAPGEIWFGSEGRDTQVSPDEAKGWVTAFDADSGAVRWKFAAPAPVVAGVTPTAGGVVFSADHDGAFLVADSTTGKKLYEYQTGSAIFAPPTTYLLDGRQYVVMPAGSTLTAFALPRTNPGTK
jgi:alcohol dehydrogenase (cytochrome c)